MYRMTKTFGNDLGYSCCFRQWRATHSHCSLLHGYSIGIRFIVEAETLDARNWVYDFGGFKKVKPLLAHWFDHTLAVAADDPKFGWLTSQPSVADVRVFEKGVGCERFSEFVYEQCRPIIEEREGVKLVSVEVFEHGANSAIYLP